MKIGGIALLALGLLLAVWATFLYPDRPTSPLTDNQVAASEMMLAIPHGDPVANEETRRQLEAHYASLRPDPARQALKSRGTLLGVAAILAGAILAAAGVVANRRRRAENVPE